MRSTERKPEEIGLPRKELLSFYDRLRQRIQKTASERGGKLGRGTAEALLVVPDIFMLLARLALDSDVPRDTRRLIGGALLYFILPVDLLPELFVGPAGFIDDLVIACAVLSEAFSKDLESRAGVYWSGDRRLASVLGDVARTSNSLLGADLAANVRRFLAKRGLRSKTS